MTSKVTVVLTTTPTTFPIGTPVPARTLVEILNDSGNVVYSQDSGYEFSGIQDGLYTMRASLLDVNGNLIGAAYTQGFSVVTAPTDPQTVTINVPSGATISVSPE